MSSGKYSALTGAISRMKMLDTISDNLSNTSTAGFKRGQSVFESMLNQTVADRQAGGINFNGIQGGFNDFSQGMLRVTGSPLHLGIQGDGFFKLMGPQEQILYTRQGSFMLSTEGTVSTIDGYRLLGVDDEPIELERPDVEIDEMGLIIQEDGEGIQIPLYGFPEDTEFERQGQARFQVVGDVEDNRVEGSQILQERLEQSNVNMMTEMARMMDTLRSFEALQKAITTYDTIAKKASDIGTIG